MTNMQEYKQRRKEFMKKIGPTSIAVFCAAKENIRNGDSTYSYRQNSDFYYLTGFEEPEAIIVLAPGRVDGEFILFNRKRDPAREAWDGPRAGQAGACADFFADQSFEIEEIATRLPNLFVGREAIFCSLGANKKFDNLLLRSVNSMRAKIRTGLQSPIAFVDAIALHEMRLFKTTTEIALIQQAIDISIQAHLRAMQFCQPGMNEYQLEAEILHEFNRHGARHAAYGSIVGAGRNSCVLHYIQNNAVIRDGDIVLIDAGAEYQNYAADITRTFPANGKFSGEQKAIYELVLSAQRASIATIKPGEVWTKPQEIIVKTMTQGLIDLGILHGSLDELIEKEAYFKFYMHRSGHWLGLDVHDSGRYSINEKWRTFEPNMVLTVEPGLYITPQTGVNSRWHHIGVRIEDDIQVVENGYKVLSEALIKDVADIEKHMQI